MGEQLGGGHVAEGDSFPVGFVYFIRCMETKFVRIGWSLDNPESRFLMTQVYSPTPVERVCVMRGTQRDEGFIHARFKKWRDHAEWFRSCEEIDLYIAENGMEWPAGEIGHGSGKRPVVISNEEHRYWMTGKGPKPPEHFRDARKRSKPDDPVVAPKPDRPSRYGPLQALLDAARKESP